MSPADLSVSEGDGGRDRCVSAVHELRWTTYVHGLDVYIQVMCWCSAGLGWAGLGWDER